MIQLSHPYTTPGETIALTTWNFVRKVKSLLFNMLSGFITAFLPRSKHLLISWLQSLSTVIREPKKRKFVIISTFSLCICCEVMGEDASILVFGKLSFKPAFSLPSLKLIKRLYLPKFVQIHVCESVDAICLSSATLFSFYLQSFPESGSFLGSWLFASGGQNIRASASVLVLPMNIQLWILHMCYRLNYAHPVLEGWNSNPLKVTVFGDRVLKKISKVKWSCKMEP